MLKFPALFILIFYAGLPELDSNSFRNSSYKDRTGGLARVFRLSFRFLWLWFVGQFVHSKKWQNKQNLKIWSTNRYMLFSFYLRLYCNHKYLIVHFEWAEYRWYKDNVERPRWRKNILAYDWPVKLVTSLAYEFSEYTE